MRRTAATLGITLVAGALALVWCVYRRTYAVAARDMTRAESLGLSDKHVIFNADETPVAYLSVNEHGQTWYHTVSKELRFARKRVHEDLEILLFDITKHAKWFDGMDGIESDLTVSAYLTATNGVVQGRLWTVKANGHELWEGFEGDATVAIVEFGCCDSPDRMDIFDSATGLQRETRERHGTNAWVAVTGRR